MAKEKNKEIVESTEEVVEKTSSKGLSNEAKGFLALIETYKTQSPEKYELKKEALQEKLKSL